MSADRFLWSRLVIGDACYQRLKRAATKGSGGSNAFFNKLLVHRHPGLVRVVTVYRSGQIGRGRSQVALIHDTVLIQDKRVNSRHAIFGRPRPQRKAADHRVLRKVVVLPARSVRTLGLQNAEIITVIRLWFRRRSGATALG